MRPLGLSLSFLLFFSGGGRLGAAGFEHCREQLGVGALGYYSPTDRGLTLEMPLRWVSGFSHLGGSLFYDFRGVSFKILNDPHNGKKINGSTDVLFQALPYAFFAAEVENDLLGFLSLLSNGALVWELTGWRYAPRLVLSNAFHPFLMRPKRWIQEEAEIGFELGRYAVSKHAKRALGDDCIEQLFAFRFSVVAAIDYVAPIAIAYQPRVTGYWVLW